MNFFLPVSVFVITLNEENNIGAALNRMTDFTEVIVIDRGSDDRTLEIAERYPNVKTYHTDWPGYSEQKSFAMAVSCNDWVLNVDADELLTNEIIDVIKNVVRDANSIAMESRHLPLQWESTPPNIESDDRVVKLFRKPRAHYLQRRAHESISADVPVSNAIGKAYYRQLGMRLQVNWLCKNRNSSTAKSDDSRDSRPHQFSQ